MKTTTPQSLVQAYTRRWTIEKILHLLVATVDIKHKKNSSRGLKQYYFNVRNVLQGTLLRDGAYVALELKDSILVRRGHTEASAFCLFWLLIPSVSSITQFDRPQSKMANTQSKYVPTMDQY